MTAKEVREKYINFFTSFPRNHKEIPPAPLVLEDDPTTLFTSSGMQPLVPYLMGEPHPSASKRLVDSQPSIRTVDIEEVGDYSHLTFFEMLGNWSLGDYFKADQIPWIFEFFTKKLGLDKDKLWVSVFEGDSRVAKDEESYNLWKNLGVAEDRIRFYGVDKNWWSRSGTPEQMPVGEIGGPDSEIFYDFGEELKIHENSLFKNDDCHPNCRCGRFLEIGNCVFIQYKKAGEGKLEELPQKNVDFGGGLERITAAVNNTPDVFMTDLFSGIIKEVENKYRVKYKEATEIDKSLRIIADHSRAATALISIGVTPSNKEQGYVLRRLIRRALIHVRKLSQDKKISLPVIDLEQFGIPIEVKNQSDVAKILEEEAGKFRSVMDLGIRKLSSLVKKGQKINGEVAFGLYQSYGFPLDLTLEVLENEGLEFTEKDKEDFKREFEKHQELSRTTSAGVFRGGLADHSPEVIKLHTATHILLSALRKVLGEHVVQKGQNITSERSRFDFPNPEKLTNEQIKKVENDVNEIISKDLPVNFIVMPKDEALKTGAIHAFNEKYADTVKVYFVGKSLEDAVSREFCGGPHVTHTGEIGHVRIKKQEKIGSGLIRIYMVLTN
jgi:alanyl-tRNA synthetase